MVDSNVNMDKFEKLCPYKITVPEGILKGMFGKEDASDMLTILSDNVPSYSLVKNWVTKFKH